MPFSGRRGSSGIIPRDKTQIPLSGPRLYIVATFSNAAVAARNAPDIGNLSP